MSPYWGLVIGAAATSCWMLGVYVLTKVFRSKPSSMKQVSGDGK